MFPANPSRSRARRRTWLGSGVAAVAIAAAWSFTRCAALPDDRCLDDGVGPEQPFEDGCMLCTCDADGHLRCYPRNCSPDAGVRSEPLE